MSQSLVVTQVSRCRKLFDLTCTLLNHNWVLNSQLILRSQQTHMLPPTIAEAEAIKSNYTKLIDGIQHELSNLVPALYQEDLIGKTSKDRAMLLGFTPQEKATVVVDTLLATINNKPSEFHSLVKVLRLNPAVSYLADQLEKSGTTFNNGTLFLTCTIVQERKR